MNALEDKVRAALRETAEEIPPHGAPPLRLDHSRGFRLRPARRHRWGSWLTPLAAAASVAGVVAASLAFAGTFGSQRPARPAASRAAHRQLGPFAGLPPYYLALTVANPRSINDQPQTAVIRATATGQPLATVTAPKPYGTFVSAAGTEDGRTFVLAAAPWRVTHLAHHTYLNASRSRLFLLRLGAGGRPRLTALPAGAAAGADMALSPDGSRLAVDDGNTTVHVYDLATGAQRTWTWPGGGRVTNNAGSGEVLSWAADDRTLAFQQWADHGNTIDVWLLDATTPGGSLQHDSRLALQWKNDAETWHFVHGTISNVLFGPSAIITPDGSKIVAATASETRQPLSSELAFTEFSAATGRPATVLGRWPLPGKHPGQTQDVLWSSPSGDKLIVVAHLPGVRPPQRRGIIFGPHIARYVIGLGVQTASGFTPLPGAPGPGPGSWPVW